MASSTHLVVLNANTSASMTEALEARARAVARPGTQVVALQPTWGPPAVQGWQDAYASAAAMVERMRAWEGPLDALVVAGFGDLGRDALRELLAAPVVDITEAAVMAAQLVGRRYGIVTTLGRMRPLIEASVGAAGQLGRCAAIAALELPVAAVAAGERRLEDRFVEVAGQAVRDGAEVLCLGSAALAPFAERLAQLSPVPVVDALAAGVALAELCCQLRLRTSPLGSWAGGPPAEAPSPGCQGPPG